MVWSRCVHQKTPLPETLRSDVINLVMQFLLATSYGPYNTLFMWLNWWHNLKFLLSKGYHWSKFQLHTMREVEISGRVYKHVYKKSSMYEELKGEVESIDGDGGVGGGGVRRVYTMTTKMVFPLYPTMFDWSLFLLAL